MTMDNVIVAVGSFIQAIVGNTVQIVRGQVNRVPLPDSPTIVLTELFSVDLETYRTQWDEPNDEATYTTPARMDIQADFYSENAADLCRRVMTLFRSRYGTDNFTNDVAPLYCSDGRQNVFITGEKQYGSRWTVTLSVQYNQDVIVTQDYFTTATDDVTLIQVT